MPADGPRPDLPGSAEPPLEGRRWLWVKLGAWGAAILLLICAAAVAAMGISSLLAGRKAAPDAPDRVVVEQAAPAVAATPDPPPVVIPVEPRTETVGLDAAEGDTSHQDAKPARRPLMRH